MEMEDEKIEKIEPKPITQFDFEQLSQTEQEKLQEELKYEERRHGFLYNILKMNPLDALNDLYREAVKKLNIEPIEGRLQWWAAYIYIKWAVRTFWNFRAEYPKKNIFPDIGAGILVGNHESHLDPFFYGAACHRRIRYMSKLDNFKTPIVRTLFTNLGAFKVDRDNPEAGWVRARQIIRGGEWVGIFPEGTRSKDGELGEFKTGAVRLAIEMGVPIVPMAIVGSKNALPKGNLMMKPSQVVVRVGDPIYYDNYDINKVSYEEIKRLNEELRSTVFELRENVYGRTEEELAEGVEAVPKLTFKSYMKGQAKGFLRMIDDIWYAGLRSLEEFGLREFFANISQNAYGWGVWELSELMAPYKVIDYDKYIPDSGAAILCTNHNSEWDVILTAASLIYHRKRILWQMAKQSLFRPPIVNAWVRTHHAFPLKRGQSDRDSYNFTKYLLDKGELVIIYPEGTTNPGGGELLEGHTGAMRLAIEKQVPILLIGITGTEDTYPKRAKMLNFYRGQILKAGPAFMEHKKYWGKPMPDYDELKRLTANMMERLRELLVYDSPDA